MSEPRVILVSALLEISSKLTERKAGDIADHLLLRLAEAGLVVVVEDDYDAIQRVTPARDDE
jgi:hypothetical protein